MDTLRPSILVMILVMTLLLLQPNTLAQQLAETPTAEVIMSRVATNQDQAQAERAHYVYTQHADVVSRKGSKVMCQEITDSRVTPSASGSHVELLKLNGRLLIRHKYVPYTALPAARREGETQITNDHDSIRIEIGGDGTDRALVESMRTNLTRDDSKDGISQRLFPLTSDGQKDYTFHWIGRERLNGRNVFHLDFRPKEKSDYGWKGDAYIDDITYQAVVVSTAMARKIPFAVRTLLGTNLPGLGFTVVYAPQPDGVWFPVSFGTEFKLHVLFFFSREIIIDAHNRDFTKTHVTTKIIDSAETVPTN